MSNDINADCEKAEPPPSFQVAVKLSGAAIDVLHQLFLNGPTWDGDVASKSGRDELHDLKLIGRHNGYQFVLGEGVRLALANGLDNKKNRRDRDQRRRLNQLDQVSALLHPAGCDTSSGVMVAAQDQQRHV